MTKPNLPELLTESGLTAYEARTYVALLSHPGAKTAVIAGAAAIPQPHVYRVLRRLLELGLATRSSAGRTVYRGVDPAAALGRLEETTRKRRERQDVALARAKQALAELYKRGARARGPEEYVEIVKNPAEIFARLRAMEAGARRRMSSFNKPPYVNLKPAPREMGKFFAPVLKALARGVKVQALFENGAGLAPVEQMAFLMERGQETRVVDRLPMKLVVVDGREVMLALESKVAGPTPTYLTISHHGLGETLEALFDRIWAEAEPLTF